jgi:chromosome segregation ATPase
MGLLETIDQEHADLALHVDLCASRYEAVEKRLASLESKVDEIHTKIDSFRTDIVKILVGSAGTISVAIITLIITIINK